MPRYDASLYDPPAPVAQVTLRDPKSGTLVPGVHLLLDTGADVTLLPRAAVEQLGVKPVVGQHFELLAFDGVSSTAQAADLDMLFLAKAFRGRYLLIDADRGIMGRDILASLALLMDGPRQWWSEHRSEKS